MRNIKSIVPWPDPPSEKEVASKKEVALRNLHQAYYEYVWVHELGEQLPVNFKQLPHQCDLESFKSEVEETALMVKVTQGY